MAFKKLKFYFDKALLEKLAVKLEGELDNFETQRFISETNPKLKDLELKDRVKVIGQALYNFIPGNFKTKTKVLNNILGEENPGEYGTFMEYFWVWPISSVIEQYGLEHKNDSLKLIYEITKRSTGEFAIRQFIRDDPDGLLKLMGKWSKDKNHHVRRLSSEGLRPRLPWAKKLSVFSENQSQVIKILENLKDDSSRYVQTSVANHLGDLLKEDYNMTMGIILE